MTFLDSLSPKALSLEDAMDLSRDRNELYCDMHAVGQQSTVETLFIAVAKQRYNGSDQRFLCGPFR
jgi:hypothetical protein